MNWLQLSYQYLVGGAFFAVTLFLCVRAANMRNRSDRKTVIVSLVGLVGYFTFHTLWIAFGSA